MKLLLFLFAPSLLFIMNNPMSPENIEDDCHSSSFNSTYRNYAAQITRINIEKYRYDNESSLNSSLAKELVINDYWQQKSAQTQYKKDRALQRLLNTLVGDHHYNLLRRNIAAAAYIGANLQTSKKQLPLHKAILSNDHEMINFLTKHGAQLKNSLLASAYRVTTAQLLINYGLDVTWKNFAGANLLLTSMTNTHEPQLIEFYKEKGISPFEFDNFNDTALHKLAAFIILEDKATEKASLLLKNLNKEEISSLINQKNKDNQTVFDYLKFDYIKSSINAQKLYKFLQLQLDQSSYELNTINEEILIG